MASNQLAPVPTPTPSLPAQIFAELPAPFMQQSTPTEIVASIRVGKAKVDIYSGADANVVKALCQVLKSC